MPDRSPARRVIIVDDSTLFRAGLRTLLISAGIEVAADLSSAAGLFAQIDKSRPDVVLLDVRMPPTNTDEGILVALQVRALRPKTGVLVLSTYADGSWADRLLQRGSAGIGYLLKDRVNDVSALVAGIERVASGDSVIDPEVVSRLLTLSRRRAPLATLTTRERDVLELMAQGMSNNGIGASLFLSPKTVETHIASIFTKLPLDAADNSVNRRVLAVLAYLDALGRSGPRSATEPSRADPSGTPSSYEQ